MRGKVGGAWILHELTRETPLDFFVLYSAAGVLLGAPGQGMYPAANAELDFLAQLRRRLGLPGLSVAWGPWANIGMAADLEARGSNIWQSRGLGKIEPTEAFADLERLLVDGAAYGAVIPIRWSTFLARLPDNADREFFGAVASTPSEQLQPMQNPQRGTIIEHLIAFPATQRRQALIVHLSELASHVLGVDASEQPQHSFERSRP